jgi:hypothetical protein
MVAKCERNFELEIKRMYESIQRKAFEESQGRSRRTNFGGDLPTCSCMRGDIVASESAQGVHIIRRNKDYVAGVTPFDGGETFEVAAMRSTCWVAGPKSLKYLGSCLARAP